MDNYFFAVVMTLIFFVPAVFAIYLKKKNMLDAKTGCALIILASAVLKLIYISYTPLDVRQHDVGEFTSGGSGHLGYIEYLYSSLNLPDFDPREKWQFYHPPLHHIICALWLRVLNLFGIGTESGVNTLQYLTLTYSVILSFFAYRIFKRLGLKSKGLVCATALVAFHPTLIILSGSVNNDMLSSLFAVMAIFYTIKWAQDMKMSDIIKTALCIGLGMFTKLSVGLIAPAVAAVFLVVFIKNIKSFKKLIPQFAVFAVICCPIGLFWSIRNYIKFGMPLNYVPMISKDSYQFLDVPAATRLTDWSLYQFASPFTQWGPSRDNGAYLEFNPFVALLKNSMFDEETLFSGNITLQSFCVALFFVNIIIIAFSLISMVIQLVKNKELKLELKLLLTLAFAVIFGNYIVFCINYPHICTQNTRYCVPLIAVGAAFVGMYIENTHGSKHKLCEKCGSLLTKLTGAFCALSSFVYTALFYYVI